MMIAIVASVVLCRQRHCADRFEKGFWIIDSRDRSMEKGILEAGLPRAPQPQELAMGATLPNAASQIDKPGQLNCETEDPKPRLR